MRWGVREETGNNHGTSAMCMKELARCHAESVGPSFVCFLGDRYGSRFFPAKVPKEEVEVLFEWIGSHMPEAMPTLNKWLLLNENKLEPEYILQPIDSIYPAYTDQSAWAKHKEAKIEQLVEGLKSDANCIAPGSRAVQLAAVGAV